MNIYETETGVRLVFDELLPHREHPSAGEAEKRALQAARERIKKDCTKPFSDFFKSRINTKPYRLPLVMIYCNFYHGRDKMCDVDNIDITFITNYFIKCTYVIPDDSPRCISVFLTASDDDLPAIFKEIPSPDKRSHTEALLCSHEQFIKLLSEYKSYFHVYF